MPIGTQSVLVDFAGCKPDCVSESRLFLPHLFRDCADPGPAQKRTGPYTVNVASPKKGSSPEERFQGVRILDEEDDQRTNQRCHLPREVPVGSSPYFAVESLTKLAGFVEITLHTQPNALEHGACQSKVGIAGS